MPSKADDKLPSVLKSLATGLFITFVILGLKWSIDDTLIYRNLQKAAYASLQGYLRPKLTRKDLPVVLLDISPLKPITTRIQGREFSETPRRQLTDLIKSLAERHPKVIGVDIDFSPTEFGYVDFRDPAFFRELIKISQDESVQIFLGIKRSDSKPTSQWLSDKEFSGLAADISIPLTDNRKMFKSLALHSAEDESQELSRGRTMCSALASAFPQQAQSIPPKLSRFVRQTSGLAITPTLTGEGFLVDFSPLAAIRDMRLTTGSNDAIQTNAIQTNGWMFTDKAVLIGDGTATDPRDEFIAPLPDDDISMPVPGAYFHVCAAYTLIKAPLFEFTGLGRVSTDLLLSIIVLFCVSMASIHVERNTNRRFAELRTAYVFVLIVSVVAILFGVAFVYKTRVIWDDFLFVIVALWIHPALHQSLMKLWTLMKTKGPALINQLFTKQET